MQITLDISDEKLENVIFKAVNEYVIDKHVDNLIHRNDGQLKMMIISTCTKAVHEIFNGEAFKEWVREAIRIEIEKVKRSIEHSQQEYSISINQAIKEEVHKKVKSVVSEPGFDHYIMGCVQLEVKDKLLTIE